MTYDNGEMVCVYVCARARMRVSECTVAYVLHVKIGLCYFFITFLT